MSSVITKLTQSELFRDIFCFGKGHINMSAQPNFQQTSILYTEQFILAYGENIKTEASSV